MFDILVFIIPILSIGVFIFVISTMFSTKLRAKMMGKQIESIRYMLEESQEDLSKIGNTTIGVKHKILKDNKDILKEMANTEADVRKDAITTTVKAIKDGITSDKIFCKHCGKSIDSDSKYCSKCGKKI